MGSSRLLSSLAAGLVLFASAAWAQDGAKQSADVLLDALTQELERSKEQLTKKGEEPLYYLSYRVSDAKMFVVAASYGAIQAGLTSSDDPYADRMRILDVSVRVGSHKLDNTHKIRGGRFGSGMMGRFSSPASLPLENDLGSIRVAVWRATDRAYKAAVKQLINVKTNKAVKVEEEDKADDFSREEPQVLLSNQEPWDFDKAGWKTKVKKLSAIFKAHPHILRSSVMLQGGSGTTYFVDNDGAQIREPRFYLRVMISGSVRAEDGMDMGLNESFEAITPDQLPSFEEMEQKTRQLIANLEALRVAPVVEPYTGPAIIMNRAAAVYFHEVFGHRIEGHRQKDEDEGQTFTKKVNKQIMPEFISVVDDPTQERFQNTALNGHFKFDDEGVPAQKVPLVDKGVLKGFVMGRSPIKGFAKSNGHGRAQPGMQPVSRQGCLLVSSTSTLPFDELRKRLIEEVKKAGKPYGLMFQDISGGFTFTGRGMPQAFKVIPLLVYRVYPDGKPDELVRGVDLVGTPLASLDKILITGDDYAVFNGYCGAESGYVPVSAVAPSLLVREMEVEKKSKSHDRPPLQAPPLHPKADWPKPPEPAKTESGK